MHLKDKGTRQTVLFILMAHGQFWVETVRSEHTMQKALHAYNLKSQSRGGPALEFPTEQPK